MNGWLLYQVLGLPGLGAVGVLPVRGSVRVSAIQLQDVMALVISAPNEARVHIIRAAARQFEEATCSTGGIRRPTPVSEPHHWTTYISFRLPSTTMSRRPATLRCFDEQVPFLKIPGVRPDQEDDYNVPGVSEQMAVSTSTACAPWNTATRSVPRPAPNGHRRLERRHEQGRCPRPRRERLERVVFVTVLNAFAEADLRPNKTQAHGAESGADARTAIEPDGIGSAVLTSTTARRSLRPKTTSARSMPFRQPGYLRSRRPRPGAPRAAAVEKRLVRIDGKLISYGPSFR